MQSLMTFYERLVLDRPRLSLAVLVVVVGFFAIFVSDFRLDASTESLLLEQDSDLRYYRGIRARYSSDNYLVITYTAKEDLFTVDTLADIARLRDELIATDGLSSVIGELPVDVIQVEIQVQKSFQLLARQLIDEYESRSQKQPENSVDWTCRACHEINPETFDVCWNCQHKPDESETSLR